MADKYNFNTYMKDAKLEWETPSNMMEFFSDYNLYNHDKEKWETKNRDRLWSRSMSYGADEIQVLPDYADWRKYSGMSDEQLVRSHFGYDKISKTFENMRDTQMELSKVIPGNTIKAEKDRIGEQRKSKDYTRKDHFAIGTVYLNVPPAQISISQENHNFRYNSMRSKGETVLSSGRATTRIDLDVFFSGLDDINNKLRPLLAQFKTTPFLPIENEYIKTVLNPLGRKIASEEEIDVKLKQLDELKEREKSVKRLLEATSKKADRDNEIRERLTEMKNAGHLTNDMYTKLVQYVREPQTITPEETYPEDYVVDQTGKKQFNLVHWIRRNITVGDTSGRGLRTLERNINEIDDLSKEIETLKEQSNRISRETFDERFFDKQIVGVLSQFSISTMPGFPETLACRISLYVFNYEPFSEYFSFVAGYEKGRWTPDITKCDLFIDWYTRRFLSGWGTLDKPGLVEMIGNSETSIGFITHYRPEDVKTISQETIRPEEIILDNGITVTGITVSFRNIIQFLPLLSHKNPTCQYMGSYNSEVQINMEATSLSRLNELSSMFEKVGIVSRHDNRLARNNFIGVRNEILRLCGMRFFIINSYDINTVPDNPGLYSINLSLSEYKLNTERLQYLKREGVVTNKDVEKAAEFLLEQTYLFSTNGGKGNAENPYKEFETYHNILTNPRNGWLSDKTNSVIGFARGIGGAIGGRGIFNDDKEWEKLFQTLKGDVRTRYGTPLRDYETLERIYGEKDATRALVYEREYASVEDQDNIKRYAKDVLKSVQGKNNKEIFDGQKRTIAKILASQHRNELIALLLEVSDNQPLHDYLKKELGVTIDKLKNYCYPDLELPKYTDIPSGLKYRQTYKDNGLIPPEGISAEQSMQRGSAEVDPDFFFYKGSIWNMIDKDSLGELRKSTKIGTRNFMRLINRNKSFRYTEALSEEYFAELVGYVTEERNIAKKDPAELKSASKDINKKGTKEIDVQRKRNKLEGIPLKVVRVGDGDTFYVIADGAEYAIRPYGYNAPGNDSGSEVETYDPVNGPRATAALKGLLEGQEVELSFQNSMLDKYGRLLAHVTIKKGNKSVNVSAEMIKRAHELGLTGYNDPKNELQLYYNEEFFKAHEIYIKELLPVKKGPIKKALNIAERSFAGSSAGLLSAIPLIAGRTLIESVLGVKEEKKTLEDIAGIALSGFANLLSESIEASTNNFTAGETFRASANDLITNILYGKKNEFGYRRFDRHADKHIELIIKRMREQQKDNVLRVSRAFPTFKIYFIEEDMPEWGFLDDLYEYNAVKSIDIVKSRKEAADTAVITFLNTKGTLDTSRFGLYDKNGRYIKRGEKEKIKLNLQETEHEQNLDEFILKPGTRIKIKIGYSSDPDLLDTIFTGMVAEVNGGDLITVVAQGYGVELLQQIGKPVVKLKAAAAFKYLDKLVTRPDVLHFGKWKLAPRIDSYAKNLGRRKILNKYKGKYEHPSWWRNIGGIRHILEFRDHEADNNIWVPEQSWWYNLLHGGTQHFVVNNKTIWDVFQEMTRRMPGYIATVLPFDDRATVYFGPADLTYWYTNRNYTERKEVEMLLDDKTNEDKVRSYVDRFGYSLKEATPKEIQASLDHVAKYMTNLRSARMVKNKDVTNLLNSISLNRFSKIASSTPLKPFDINKASNFLKTTIEGTLKRTNREEAKIISDLKLLIYELSRPQEASIDATESSDGDIRFEYTHKGGKYYKIGDEIIHESDIVDRYDTIREKWLNINHPNKKLVRNYHYKDSYHHIVANNVIASEQSMYNKVTVEYGREKYWRQKELRNTPGGLARVSCQADDDIWPEKVKEVIIPERNARDIVTAWLYGLGNLWLGMREMYTGHLTMLGDASIKPYDVIFMNDYFTNMHGPIEVEQVTHHFSPETGFITTVIPDLVCYVNNIMQIGTNLIAGMYADEYSSFIMRARAITAVATLGTMQNQVANLLFKIGNLSTYHREPISFSPLLYADRPYLAGIEGFRKNSLGSATLGRISSAMNLYFKETPEHIDAYLNVFFNKFFSRGKI